MPHIGIPELVILSASLVWVWALVDCMQRDFPQPSTKVLWALAVIFGHFLGAVAYLVAGRPMGRRR